MGLGPDAIEVWEGIGKVKYIWRNKKKTSAEKVEKVKKKKSEDGNGCWVGLRVVRGCISSRSKVDGTNSTTSTIICAENPRSSDEGSKENQPNLAAASCSSATSYDESNSSTPKVASDDLKIASQLRKFTFNELKTATRNFRPESLLGEGGFGCVFKGWIEENGTAPVRPGTGLTVAVKTLNHDGLQGHKEWLAEVKFLGDLIHPNLVKLIGYCIENDQRLLAYEFLPRGSLENHLFRRSQPVAWLIRMKIALGAAKGLAFLHQEAERPVIYRDFKTSNILLDLVCIDSSSVFLVF